MNLHNQVRKYIFWSVGAFATVVLAYPFLTLAQALPGDMTSASTTDTSGDAIDTAPAMPEGPSISDVTVTDITDKSARVDAHSDEMVQGYVEYGTTEQYGHSTPLTSEFSTSPSFLLEPLNPETLYHYRVIVMDSSGSAAITADKTFTTLATPQEPAEETPPASTATTTNTTTAVNTGETSTTTMNAEQPAATTTSTNNATTNSQQTATTTQSSVSSSLLPTPQTSQTPTTSSGSGFPVVSLRPLLLKVIPGDKQVVFSWLKDAGAHNGTIHTIVVKKVGVDPVRSRVDGDVIYDGPSTTFTDTNVENGKEYHYALYSYGSFGRFTAAARFKVVPQAGSTQANTAASDTTAATPPQFSRDLFEGKQGEDVKTLQMYLNKHGFYPEALITGYFGLLTKAAVMRYQRLNEITPIAGYIGPITREVLSR